MRQHPDPDPYEDDEDLEELGTPVYRAPACRSAP